MIKLNSSMVHTIVDGKEVLIIARTVGFTIVYLADSSAKYVLFPTEIDKDLSPEKKGMLAGLQPLAERVKESSLTKV